MTRGISQSGLSVFRDCPYAFKLRYVDRCVPMFWDNSVLDVGSYVHDSIDDYYKLHYIPDAASYHEILAETYALLKRRWDRSLSVEQFKQAYLCLENHSKFEFKRLSSGIATKPLTEIEIDSGGFYGFIDYFDIDNKIAMDWKTGKHPSVHYSYKMQALIYKFLIKGKFGIDLTHFDFYFLFPNAFRKVKYGTGVMKGVEDDVLKLRRKVDDSYRDGFERKPRTSTMCNNCLYKYYCRILKM